MIMKLTFGVFAHVLRLCKKRGVTDTQIVGSMTRTVDPDCGYMLKANKDTVSAIIKCERNLSPGNIEESGSGAMRRPSESISNVVQAAQGADFDTVSAAFVSGVIRFLDENKKQNAVLALLDIIRNDDSLDDDGFDGMKLNFDKYTKTTKKALLSQSSFVLSDFLAGLFLYTASFGLQNTDGKSTFVLVTADYVKTQSVEEPLTIYDGRDSKHPISPTLSRAQLRRRVVPQPQPAFFTYLGRIKDNNDRIKTLFYNETPHPFYDFYVCNDISRFWHFGFSGDVSPELDRLITEDERNLSRTIKNTDINKLSEVSRFVIITGTGGLGKSMMMRHLLLSTINNYDAHPLIPVLVLLKDYDGKVTDLFEFSYSYISNLDSNITREDYINALKSGSCLILLDGLDEVGLSLSDTFERALRQFVLRYPDNHYVISSRPYQNFVSFNDFSVLRMLPFSKEQALQLIDNLDYRPDNPAIKKKFRTELDERLCESHPSFIQNPLLLTIMLMTFARYAEVPSKMHVFYKDAYDALASVHDASKGAYKRSFKTGLTPDVFADYLAEICFRTYSQERFEFTKEEFYKTFSELIIGNGTVNPDDFLYDLCYCLCLMYREGEKYYFQHRSFQEYFTALFMSRQKDDFLKRIGQFFEKHMRRTRTDQTFDMLRDMIPDKVSSFVIAPYLQEILTRYSAPNGYHQFLCDMYPRIRFTVGEESRFPDSYVRTPVEYMLRIIIFEMLDYGLIDIRNYNHYVDLPEHEDFLSRTLVKISSGEKDAEHFEIVPLDFLMREERSETVKHKYTVVGKVYSYETEKVFSDITKYADIAKALDAETFVHRIEFEKLREYLNFLLAKQKSTDDSLLDLL